MLGANQTRSDGTGVGTGVKVLVALLVGEGIEVSDGRGEFVGRGVSSTIRGTLQAVRASITKVIGLRGTMYRGPLYWFMFLSHSRIGAHVTSAA